MKNKEKDWIMIILVGALVVSAAAVGAKFYMSDNDGEPVINMVSKTEYVPNDDGQVITELRYSLSNEPVNANCEATVLYPNKTALFSGVNMTDRGNGTHYTNFSVPSTEGVYEYQVKCESNSNNYTTSSSFHVSSSFRRLQDDIRSQVGFTVQGTREVEYRRDSRNGWKLESSFVNNITDLSCRIRPVDSDADIHYEDSYNADPQVTLVSVNTPTSPSSGSFDTNESYRDYADGNVCDDCRSASLTVGTERLFSDTRIAFAGFVHNWIERNLSFVPSRITATTDVDRAEFNPYQMNYMVFHYFGNNDTHLGSVYLSNRLDGFSNCNGNTIAPLDSCGLYNRCYGTVPNNTVCVTKSTQSEINWNVNLIEKANEANISLEDVERVLFRWADQSRKENFENSLDNLIIVSEPIGKEFINNDNLNFGVNWTATEDTVEPFNEYQVACSVVYENEDSSFSVSGLEQYVHINYDNRLMAQVVK